MIIPEVHFHDVDTPISHVASNGTVVDGGAMLILPLSPVRDSQGQDAREASPGSSGKKKATQSVEETTCLLHEKIFTDCNRLGRLIPDFHRRPSAEPHSHPRLSLTLSVEDWTMPVDTWLASGSNLPPIIPRRIIWGFDDNCEAIHTWQMKDGQTLTNNQMVLEPQLTGRSITDTIQYQCKCRAKKGGNIEGCLRLSR
jgi:hypothetical protein